MVGTNLQRLIPSHNQPRLPIFPMLQQPYVPRATLFPIPTTAIEFKQLGTHLEDLLFALFICFCWDLFRQVHDGLEVDIG